MFDSLLVIKLMGCVHNLHPLGMGTGPAPSKSPCGLDAMYHRHRYIFYCFSVEMSVSLLSNYDLVISLLYVSRKS